MENPRYRIGRIGIFLCLSLLLAMTAHAATPVGKVTQAIDSVKAGRQVSSGEAVFEGDTFSVGANGSMIILFDDDSVLTLKPGSRATISTFRMGGKGKPGMALIKATDGKYRFTPGKILSQGGVQFVSKDTASGAAAGQGVLVAQNQAQGGGQTSAAAANAGGATAGSTGTQAAGMAMASSTPGGGTPATAAGPAGGTAAMAASGQQTGSGYGGGAMGSSSPGNSSMTGSGQPGSFAAGGGTPASTGGFSPGMTTPANASAGNWTAMVASTGSPSTPGVATGTWGNTSGWTGGSDTGSSSGGTSGGVSVIAPGGFAGGTGGFVSGSGGFAGMQDPCALGGCGNGPSGAPTGGNAMPAPDMMLASAIGSPSLNLAGGFNSPSANLNLAGGFNSPGMDLANINNFNASFNSGLSQSFNYTNLISGFSGTNALGSMDIASGNLLAGMANFNVGTNFNTGASFNNLASGAGLIQSGGAFQPGNLSNLRDLSGSFGNFNNLANIGNIGGRLAYR